RCAPVIRVNGAEARRARRPPPVERSWTSIADGYFSHPTRDNALPSHSPAVRRYGQPSMDTRRASTQSIVLLPTTVGQTPRPDVVPVRGITLPSRPWSE